VRYPSAGGATTESLVTRSRSGTIRRIRATHDRAKLRAVGAEPAAEPPVKPAQRAADQV
jgi:hypothetical protein